MRDRQSVSASARPLEDNILARSINRPTETSDAPAEAAVKTDDLFKACFEHASIGFSITDLEVRLLAVNSAYCAITGYTEAELRAADLKALIHPDDLAVHEEKLQALKAGEIPAFTTEERYIRHDGS